MERCSSLAIYQIALAVQLLLQFLPMLLHERSQQGRHARPTTVLQRTRKRNTVEQLVNVNGEVYAARDVGSLGLFGRWLRFGSPLRHP